MGHLLLFGLGYSGARIKSALEHFGWKITGVKRRAEQGALAFDDGPAIRAAIASATHILSSVPPADGMDPVLAAYGDYLKQAPARWTGYLSATGVYGDTGGAYVDETAPIGGGRRTQRVAADLAWQALRGDTRIFRLPGIYGPGRSPLDRVKDGRARRIDLPLQCFSRVHVDDIASGVAAAMHRGPPGIYNLADDFPCGQNRVIEYACGLLGAPLPPLQSLEDARLSPEAMAFYSENRRIANGKARRLLGWRPRYPDYRAGLRALL
jgi:nucleoside-diphosphate-sugar epimerase